MKNDTPPPVLLGLKLYSFMYENLGVSSSKLSPLIRSVPSDHRGRACITSHVGVGRLGTFAYAVCPFQPSSSLIQDTNKFEVFEPSQEHVNYITNGILSNFGDCKMKFEDIDFISSEHAYQ